MLGQSRPGAPQLLSAKAQDLSSIQSNDYSYSGWSPLSEREAVYDELTLGMGTHIQDAPIPPKSTDSRYLYAQSIDASVLPWCKGPELTMFTPASVDAVTGAVQFFELGSPPTLYCANGRYILRRVDDATWNMVKDFGATAKVLNVAVFTSNFDGVQRAFVALSSGVAQYTTDGTTWTPMATFASLGFVAIGREFWWADDTNRLRKCDTNADPTNEANYTNLIFRAGDKSSPITALMVSAVGTLVIAKTDGLYTLDQAGDDHDLFPFLKLGRDQNNGKYWGQFENDLYTSYGYSLAKIASDLSWQDVGPEKLVNNDSPIHGRVTAFCGVGSLFAYAAVFNPDTQTGYLCKFGAWITRNLSSEVISTSMRAFGTTSGVDAVHIDAWHGSVVDPLTSRAIQTLFVSSVGAPSGHTRTYLGCSDGTIGWLINPCVPNPAGCTAYRFHVGDGWVQLPNWHGGFHASIKSIRHFAVTGTRLDANNYLTIEYKADPSAASWTALNNNFDSSVYEMVPLDPVVTTVLAQFRFHLHNTADTASPLVLAVAVGHALRPQRIMQFDGDILVADGLVRRDGVPMRIGRKKIQQYIEWAVDNPGALTCTLPDETVQELSFVDLKVSQSFDEVGRQWRGSLHVTAVQHFTTEIQI